MPTARKTVKHAAKPAAKSAKAGARKTPARKTQTGRKTSSARKGAPKARRTSATKGTARKSAPAARRGQPARRPPPDAIELLTRDHREVQKMFRKAERMDAKDPALQDLVRQACDALTLHARVEETLLYPALRDRDEGMIEEANVEHDVAKDLIAQLSGMAGGDEHYKATFKVLGEYVNHHVEEEEGQIFRLARRAKLDLDAIGEEIRGLKEEAAALPSRSGPGRSARKASANGAATARSEVPEDDEASDPIGEDRRDHAAHGRTDGDVGEDTEQPGRSGRLAQGLSGDETEIEVETPDARAGGTRRNIH